MRTSSLPNSLIARAARAFSRKNASACAATRKLRRETSIAARRSPAVAARLSAAKTITTAAIDGTASSMTTTIAIDITPSSSACSSCAVTSDWIVSTERLRLRMSALWWLQEEARRLAVQGAHEAILQLVADARAEDRERPGADDRDRRLQQDDEGEADRQHPDQAAVRRPAARCRSTAASAAARPGPALPSGSTGRRSRAMSLRQCESGARKSSSDTLRPGPRALRQFGETRVSRATPVNERVDRRPTARRAARPPDP